jgi:hypothetical protein
MGRVRHTCISSVARTKSGSMEIQVINQDQDVHVCGWMKVWLLLSYDVSLIFIFLFFFFFFFLVKLLSMLSFFLFLLG